MLYYFQFLRVSHLFFGSDFKWPLFQWFKDLQTLHTCCHSLEVPAPTFIIQSAFTWSTIYIFATFSSLLRLKRWRELKKYMEDPVFWNHQDFVCNLTPFCEMALQESQILKRNKVNAINKTYLPRKKVVLYGVIQIWHIQIYSMEGNNLSAIALINYFQNVD